MPLSNISTFLVQRTIKQLRSHQVWYNVDMHVKYLDYILARVPPASLNVR